MQEKCIQLLTSYRPTLAIAMNLVGNESEQE